MSYNQYQKAKDLRTLNFAVYRFLISQRHSVIFQDEYKVTKDFYGKTYKRFREVVNQYLEGDIIKAMQSLREIVKDDASKNFILPNACLKKGTRLYRMRKTDKYHLLERKGLFHVPLDKRSGLANARYSLNGFPCLYLGTTLYVCWEEMRRPDIEKVNFVKMTALRDINVVSTLCPETFSTERDVILFFIFALCSKEVKDDNETFKFSYAFPEMLLHLLINDKNEKGKITEPYGIKYISSKFFENDGRFSSEGLFYNYVIPVYGEEDTDDHLCKGLKEAFKVSEPYAIYVNRVYGHSSALKRSRPNEYTNTLFSELEGELKAKKKL